MKRTDSLVLIRRLRWALSVAVAMVIAGSLGLAGVRYFQSRDARRVVGSARSMPQGVSFAELFKLASDAVARGDETRSEELAGFAEAAAGTDLERAEVLNLRGVLEVQANRNADAAAWFLKAIALNSRNAAFYQNLAEALRAEKLPDAAVPAMRRALVLKPGDFLLKVKWSLLLLEAGEGQQVAESINKLSKQRALSAEWGFAKVVLLDSEDKQAEADALLSELKTKLPQPIFNACMADRMMESRQSRTRPSLAGARSEALDARP